MIRDTWGKPSIPDVNIRYEYSFSAEVQQLRLIIVTFFKKLFAYFSRWYDNRNYSVLSPELNVYCSIRFPLKNITNSFKARNWCFWFFLNQIWWLVVFVHQKSKKSRLNSILRYTTNIWIVNRYCVVEKHVLNVGIKDFNVLIIII